MQLCTYLCCSCTVEEAEERVTDGLKVYHDTLLAHGVSGYSFESLNRDFDNAIWHALTLGTFSAKMVPDIEAAGMAAPEGSPEREEALTMVKNLTALFKMMSDRAHNLTKIRPGAFTPSHFQTPGY